MDDSIFLFDESVDQYFSEVHRRAMQLRRVQRTIARGEQLSEKQWARVQDEELEIMNWFEEQYSASRVLFAKYLRLAC